MKEMFMNKCIWWLWITQGFFGCGVGGFLSGIFAPKVAKVFVGGLYPVVDFGWGIGLRINNTIK
jgi:hypothetical protein